MKVEGKGERRRERKREGVLLTGGTGFLGRHLAPELAARARARGWALFALVRPPLDRAAVRELEGLGFKPIAGDLRGLDPRRLAQELTITIARAGVGAKLELVIHLAAVLEGTERELWEVNFRGTERLLAAARAAGASRMIHLSSVGASPDPRLPYAHSIWQAERAVEGSGLNFAILRPTVLLGPGDPFTGGLLRLLRWPVAVLPRSGARFQPLWVGDLVRCLLHLVEAQRLPDKVIELGGPEVVTLAEFFELLQAVMGKRRPVLFLPRRPLRGLIRLLRRWGLETGLNPSHLLGSDNLAAPAPASRPCPPPLKPLREALAEIVGLQGERKM